MHTIVRYSQSLPDSDCAWGVLPKFLTFKGSEKAKCFLKSNLKHLTSLYVARFGESFFRESNLINIQFKFAKTRLSNKNLHGQNFRPITNIY